MKQLLYSILNVIFGRSPHPFSFLPISLKVFIQNKNEWEKKYKRAVLENKYVLAEANSNIFIALGVSLLANYTALSRKSRILYYEEEKQSSNLFFKRLRDSFTNSTSYSLDEFLNKNRNEVKLIVDKELSGIRSPLELYNYSYNGLLVGDLIYDYCLRVCQQSTIVEISQNVKESISYCLSVLISLDDVTSKYEIDYTVFSHNISICGIIQRFFMRKEVWGVTGIIGSGPIRKFSSFSGGRNTYVGEIPQATIQAILHDRDMKNKVLNSYDNLVKERYSGKSKQKDAVLAFNPKHKIYSNKNEFCSSFNLDSEKPNVFISLHVFTDFPNHFLGVYKDYFDWMIKTLEIIVKNDKVNWIIKEHPASHLYRTKDLDLRKIIDSKVGGYKNIVFFPRESNFNSASIQYVADTIVTASGSSAIEFACFGIPSLICSKSYYQPYDISFYASSMTSYEEQLLGIQGYKELGRDKRDVAKIIYYLTVGVVWGNNWNSDGFIPKMSGDNSASSIANVLTYYFNYRGEGQQYTKRLEDFIADNNQEMFFRDEGFAHFEKQMNV